MKKQSVEDRLAKIEVKLSTIGKDVKAIKATLNAIADGEWEKGEMANPVATKIGEE